ncbi:GNAT family N-acetyltransferase [Ornithinimicrobium flavum]|uniref:GNAT family N-acetyltransferase n=1 Tax=Ornithinimicrobium flavum TaxID=1288636 RepID=UPI00106F91F8|nr:GNAT family N-acetyltransferase [Ornithinimicrobium flavum]
MNDTTPRASWLPDDFVHPVRVELPTGHRLRPIREEDVDLDYPAVMGSRERLWSIYGEAWGWPPSTMTVEQDREDLAHHAAEIERHESFNYALFDQHETALLGCVYIEPTVVDDVDAEVSWWVVDDLVGTPVEKALDSLLPVWLEQDWPLRRPMMVGREVSWAEWLVRAPQRG